MAAVSGGITSVACFPNTDPAVDSEGEAEFVVLQGKRAGYAHRYSTDPADGPRIKENANEALVARWKIVDAHLAAHGPYHLGDRFSLVDLYLLFSAANFEVFPFGHDRSLDDLPAVKRCYDLVAARPRCAPILAAHINGIHELLGRYGSGTRLTEQIGSSQAAGL